MNLIFTAIAFCCFTANALAQKDSVFFMLVDTVTGGKDEYYLASNKNNWNPHDENYHFKKDKDGSLVMYKFFDNATRLEFKFTRGSWQTVECSSKGSDIENRYLQTDTTKFIVYHISGWKDKFAASEKKHTASPHVQVMDTAFFMPQLNRYRRIWVYLPEDYTTSAKRYPVMYLHDGQNVFDEYTSGFGEWGVDECLDTLIAKGKPPCIVIGIDNDGLKRMGEYNPYSFTLDGRVKQTFPAEGDAYVQFIANTLKPLIDKKYRTIPSKENTIIAGSSMGGLISYYAAIKCPHVFGKAGIFSPAFWTAPAISNLTDSIAGKLNTKLFFYMGGQEGERYLGDMDRLAERIGLISNAMIYSVTDAEGRHNESAWRKWFADFYNWIMADGYNSPIRVEE